MTDLFKNGIDDFRLKCIALICMIIDHMGEYLNLPLYFRYIGRLAAPIFIFCCVQGCLHTGNRKQYMLRLYIGACVMAVFDAWAGINVNFFRTLFSICVLIFVISEYKKTQKKKIWVFYLLWQAGSSLLCYLVAINPWIDLEAFGAYLLPALLGNVLFLEGGLFFVFIGIWFYYAGEDKVRLSVGYLFMVFIFIVGMQSNPYLTAIFVKAQNILGDPVGPLFYGMFEDVIGQGFLCIGSYYYQSLSENYQWMMIGALPVLWLYNGEKGRSGKWFFYVFYPVHYILLYCIQTYVLS